MILILLISALIGAGNTDFNQELMSYLNKQLAGYSKIEIVSEKMPNDYKSLKLRPESQININGGYAYIPVDVVSKGGREYQAYISLTLKLYKNVLVATKQINRKDRFSEDDFVLQDVDMTRYNGKPFTSAEGIENYRSKTVLRKGAVLLEENIEEVPVINSGDRVKASAVEGNVIVTIDATALQDGLTGEEIRIVTSENKSLVAKVVDSKNVIIQE